MCFIPTPTLSKLQPTFNFDGPLLFLILHFLSQILYIVCSSNTVKIITWFFRNLVFKNDTASGIYLFHSVAWDNCTILRVSNSPVMNGQLYTVKKNIFLYHENVHFIFKWKIKSKCMGALNTKKIVHVAVFLEHLYYHIYEI